MAAVNAALLSFSGKPMLTRACTASGDWNDVLATGAETAGKGAGTAVAATGPNGAALAVLEAAGAAGVGAAAGAEEGVGAGLGASVGLL